MKFDLIIITIAIIFFACKKTASYHRDPASYNMVTGSVSGRVTDLYNAPVSNALVNAGKSFIMTDVNGQFILKNVQLSKDAGFVKVTHDGYFTGSRTFFPNPNATNNVKIRLIPKTVSENFAAPSGGVIEIPGGGFISIGGGSIVNATTGASYSGGVSVSTFYLDPADPNVNEFMPGDMSGVDVSDQRKILQSFGMVAIEMHNATGEKMQLAPGKTATITLPVSSAFNHAPATIPLWYFDETTSLWKEEGQAVKTGNNYVGSVSHFTWWNYDYGYGRATITGRVVDCEGIPLSNITVTVNNQMTIVTDQDGNYTSWVPAGFGLTFQVLPQGAINVSSQLENIGALADNQVMTVPDLNIGCGARITGHIINCAHENTSGNIILKVNNYPVYFGFTETGSFNFFVMPNTVYMLEFETEDGVTSQNITSPAPNVTVDLGSIVVCSDASSRNGFTIDGDGFNHFDVNIVRDSVNTLGYSMMYGTFANIWGNYSSDTASIHFEIMADAQHHSNTEPDLFSLSVGGVFYSLSMGTTNDLVLNIDYYGAIGDSIKGTFSGHLYSDLNNQVPVMITNGRFGGIRVQ